MFTRHGPAGLVVDGQVSVGPILAAVTGAGGVLAPATGTLLNTAFQGVEFTDATSTISAKSEVLENDSAAKLARVGVKA